MSLTYRSTVGRRLTVTEGDGNISHLDKDTASANIRNYGAADSSDISAAFNAIKTAFPYGCRIVIPETSSIWALTTQIATVDGSPYIIEGRGISGKIQKQFNGDMLSLGAQSVMDTVYLDGNGTTYTGRGVVVSTGANNNSSWRAFLNCEIRDTSSNCIDFTADTAGFKSLVQGGRYIPVSTSVAAFKLPTDTVGNRMFVGVDTGDAVFAELGASQNTSIVGSQGGVPDFSGKPVKAKLTGNRFAEAGAVTFDGTDLNVVGNVFAQSTVIYSSTLTRSRITNNGFPTHTVTDNAGGFTSANEIDYGWFTYTPTVSSASSTCSLGNGTIGGAYRRQGQDMRVTINMTVSSTTSCGVGAINFSLPVKSGRLVTGTARLTDSGTGFYSGISEIAANSSTMNLLFGSNQGNYFTSSVPFTLANGDSLVADIFYPVSG